MLDEKYICIYIYVRKCINLATFITVVTQYYLALPYLFLYSYLKIKMLHPLKSFNIFNIVNLSLRYVADTISLVIVTLHRIKNIIQ